MRRPTLHFHGHDTGYHSFPRTIYRGFAMTTHASTHAWFNGEIGPREIGAPSIASINLHLGTGVFDGLMAYWNDDHYYLHRSEAHLLRFVQGAARMGLVIPWSVGEMLSGVTQLLSLEPCGTQYVRPIAYRRAPELWVTGNRDRPVDVSIFTVRVDRELDTPIACHLSPIERISSRSIPGQIKVTGAYVNSFHARYTAESAGFQDGIMLDRERRITEASAANVFVIRGNRLLTPRLFADIFPGITRQVVLELAQARGIECREVDLYERDLDGIDGAFLCSTLMEIRGINRLGCQELDTTGHNIYRALTHSFRELTRQ
jgi:branched-chain amino acid aminotransferase